MKRLAILALGCLTGAAHAIWRGKGKKDDRKMAVAVDIKGNVVSQ